MKPEEYPTAHQLAKKLLEMPDLILILPMPVFDGGGDMMALPVDCRQTKIGDRDVIVIQPLREPEAPPRVVANNVDTTDDHLVRCANCLWSGEKRKVLPLAEAPGLGERLDEGAEVPAGECPQCKAFCYFI